MATMANGKQKPSEKSGKVHWKQQLQAIIDEFNGMGLRKDKVVSSKTQHERASTLFLMVRQLNEGGFHLGNLRNLKPYHVEYLTRRWDLEGLAPSTLKSRLSSLGGLAKWIGKPGMVRDPLYYWPAERVKRSYVAKEDKSPSKKGIDVKAKIAEIKAYDERHACCIQLQHAFGLRRKEAVMFKPFRADKGLYIALDERAGTKGGRGRTFPIDTDYKRETLDWAKRLAKTPDGHIGDPRKRLKQALYRYDYVMRKFGLTEDDLGVTGHAFRHEYANDRYEELASMPSPARGGTGGLTEDEQRRDELARLQVTEELGHGRLSITSAYYGSSPQARKAAKTAAASPDNKLLAESTDARQ